MFSNTFPSGALIFIFSDAQAVFDVSGKKSKSGKDSFRDEEFYMSHYQKDADTEKGCVLRHALSRAGYRLQC